MPALIAAGSAGQASTTAAKSASNRASRAESAPLSAPLLSAPLEFAVFCGYVRVPPHPLKKRSSGHLRCDRLSICRWVERFVGRVFALSPGRAAG
jgi:hypothetical protein